MVSTKNVPQAQPPLSLALLAPTSQELDQPNVNSALKVSSVLMVLKTSALEATAPKALPHLKHVLMDLFTIISKCSPRKVIALNVQLESTALMVRLPATVQQDSTVTMVQPNLLRMEPTRKEISNVHRAIIVKLEQPCQPNVQEEPTLNLLEEQKQETSAKAVIAATTVSKENQFKEFAQEVTTVRIDTRNHSLALIILTIISREQQMVLLLVLIAQKATSAPGKVQLTTRISHALLGTTAAPQEQLVQVLVQKVPTVMKRVFQALVIASNAHKVTIALQLP